MILFDTPNETILRVMFSEWDKVFHFVTKNDEKVRKHFRNLRPPYTTNIFTQEYTVPSSKNTYTVVSSRDAYGEIRTWWYLKTDGDYGMRKFIVLKKNARTGDELLLTHPWVLDVYTGHFLSRYRERTGSLCRSTEDLFVQFLQQNSKKGMGIPAYLVNPAIDKNDDRQYAVICEEGLSFVEMTETTLNGIKIAINENKTFVAKDNLYYRQAASLLTTDYIVTKTRLKKAQEEGASAERLMKILGDGFFEAANP